MSYRTFSRSTLASGVTTAIDFAVLTSLVELARVDYVLATFLGSLAGATSSFWINRIWVFETGRGRTLDQAARFVLVQLGAALWHTCGVWLLVEQLAIRYPVAKAIAMVATYLAWNYPLNRRFVFDVTRYARSRARPGA